MNKKIFLADGKIVCLFKRSSRAKKLRLTVSVDGKVVAVAPNSFTEKAVREFLQKKTKWILKKIDLFKSEKFVRLSEKITDKEKDFLKNKRKAEKIIAERVRFYAKKHGFVFNKIVIRNQKTRWGSCSEKKNLNFNYKLIYLTKKQIDYVVVHELCHLKELNHSDKFWNLVKEILPDYMEIRKGMKNIII